MWADCPALITLWEHELRGQSPETWSRGSRPRSYARCVQSHGNPKKRHVNKSVAPVRLALKKSRSVGGSIWMLTRLVLLKGRNRDRSELRQNSRNSRRLSPSSGSATLPTSVLTLKLRPAYPDWASRENAFGSFAQKPTPSSFARCGNAGPNQTSTGLLPTGTEPRNQHGTFAGARHSTRPLREPSREPARDFFP